MACAGPSESTLNSSSSVPPRNHIPSPPPLVSPTHSDQVSSGLSASQASLSTSPQPRTEAFIPAINAEQRNLLFNPDEDTPPGWVKYIHLDGGTYYRDTNNRVLTPDDVTQPRIRECVERLLSLVMSGLREQNLLADLPKDFEIVAERMDPEVPEVLYFVSQSLKQVINYAYDCPCSNPTHLREQCPSPKLRLETTSRTRFWKHLASYPMHITALPPESEVDFLKVLVHGSNERILDERKSMFPYTDEQAQRFMQVYRDLKCVPYGQGRYSVLPALAWHISRVMIKIEAVRELYHYGTKKARVYRDIAVETPTWRKRLVDVLLFCVFFNSHRTYRERLESTRPKGHVYLPDFRELMKSLLVEWSDSNLLATVFVSANVAFLSVPNNSAFPQIASLCSTLFSMLSIVIGVHHVWRHRRRAEADDNEASQYLRLRSHRLHGSLTLLACFLALPLAALLWAILSFTVAVAAFCFVSTVGTDVQMRGLFAGVLGVLLALAVLTLLVFWDAWRTPPTSEPEEDFARGVEAARKLERESWMRHARQRLKIIQNEVRTMIGRAFTLRRKVGRTTSEDSEVEPTKEGNV
ncbi:hypothetical protein B0F90DRAFT_322641 [Multifurca ochricompacta]|uniref:Uncharacterized protein n=1 Tax=Multifurca ochricompacta TaxID=376703 RepID=A0AAD4M507_9AGAM|nr:hypothetical protein B0F90DRAFT_322641 [Multifurca ochricompacta]